MDLTILTVFLNISQFYLLVLDGRIRVNNHIDEVRITLRPIRIL